VWRRSKHFLSQSRKAVVIDKSDGNSNCMQSSLEANYIRAVSCERAAQFTSKGDHVFLRAASGKQTIADATKTAKLVMLKQSHHQDLERKCSRCVKI
jgi:hypothetical protein